MTEDNKEYEKPDDGAFFRGACRGCPIATVDPWLVDGKVAWIEFYPNTQCPNPCYLEPADYDDIRNLIWGETEDNWRERLEKEPVEWLRED